MVCPLFTDQIPIIVNIIQSPQIKSTTTETQPKENEVSAKFGTKTETQQKEKEVSAIFLYANVKDISPTCHTGYCNHISYLKSDLIWVNHEGNLLLKNLKGETLYHSNNIKETHGSFTVNRNGDLFYIDKSNDIKELSNDLKTITPFTTTGAWTPLCLFFSFLSGDLLVGMKEKINLTSTCEIVRYKKTKKSLQKIRLDNTGHYNHPAYITENKNRDIVVSDSGAVVVTDHKGSHRFSYTGHPNGSILEPLGICTDTLANILVCDKSTQTIQMISKDGQFLTCLLTKSKEYGFPCSLSYDLNTRSIWVGTKDKVFVYKYDATTVVYSYSNMINYTAEFDVNTVPSDQN